MRDGNICILNGIGLNPNFNGLLAVSKVMNNGVTYQVRSPESAEFFWVHHSQLQLYKPPPQYLQDHQMFRELTCVGHAM
jgi:hypothetical protein